MNYVQKIGFILILALMTIGCGNSESASQTNETPLKISAFKDITAFVLESAQENGSINVEIKYVKNATEAHSDLTEQKADMVFMSYDDTLSIALEDNYSDIIAIMPIHGGMLDFCGNIDIPQNKTLVGIDTNTGYARALRAYLKFAYSPSEYNKLHFTFAGATNLRYTKLLNGEIDATLLNPPYSYGTGINRMIRMNDFLGAYQGVVVNVNKSWLATSNNKNRMQDFAKAYYQTVADMKNNPSKTIEKMRTYYGITTQEATLSYNRLWESDGLSMASVFNDSALRQTERIFSEDTNVTVPNNQTWIYGLN